MDYIAQYESWLNEPTVDEGTKKELWDLQSDEKEIRERFAKHLEFGTGGLRGIMGAGTNRINVYTIRRATQGLAAYIQQNGEELKEKGVVIAYDCRLNGAVYALETALVLVANGIKTYLFDELCPTPELSFAVRHLSATAGIVVTASHNPKQYNGYKVYWSDGGQLPPSVSDKVLEVINNTEIFDIKTTTEEFAIRSGLLSMIGEEVDDAYIQAVKEQSINGGGDISIVYSPLHGAGNKPVRRVLKESGFSNVTIVKEQELPDGRFPTVENPNPEYEEAFNIGIKYADEVGADLIFATDPDSDRVGVCARNKNNKFARVSGNQMGALLTEYILSQKQKNGV
ncbi:MAG: phospho-sugar mutase, partial [Eubacteriales bacterium]|nr:phospho-sugar mutase [Eubacteriales bacterium]